LPGVAARLLQRVDVERLGAALRGDRGGGVRGITPTAASARASAASTSSMRSMRVAGANARASAAGVNSAIVSSRRTTVSSSPWRTTFHVSVPRASPGVAISVRRRSAARDAAPGRRRSARREVHARDQVLQEARA
jgi:hypothetical protein